MKLVEGQEDWWRPSSRGGRIMAENNSHHDPAWDATMPRHFDGVNRTFVMK